MDEHMNNVGRQTMGSASSVPGSVQGAAPMPQFGAPIPAQPYPQYSQQPAPSAAEQSSQNASSVTPTAPYQNNNAVTSTTTPVTADDSDLIEKEWVEKAKAIVEKTRRDPFLQSQELNRFKADYLQKRYGKNIGADGE